MPRWMPHAITVVGYFLSGVAGLQLRMLRVIRPPSPAAGWALAALLLYGARVLPGMGRAPSWRTWLSRSAPVWTASSGHRGTDRDWRLCPGLAGQSVLIRRRLGEAWQRLEQDAEILQFTVLRRTVRLCRFGDGQGVGAGGIRHRSAAGFSVLVVELVAGRYAGRADRGTAQSAVAAASHRYLAPADAAAGAADRDHPVADRGRVLLRRFLGKAPARGRPRGAQREIAFRLQHHFDAVGDVLSSLQPGRSCAGAGSGYVRTFRAMPWRIIPRSSRSASITT